MHAEQRDREHCPACDVSSGATVFLLTTHDKYPVSISGISSRRYAFLRRFQGRDFANGRFSIILPTHFVRLCTYSEALRCKRESKEYSRQSRGYTSIQGK